ncbi:hypothetical protein JNW91_21105 [Micromonospora sp. STR1_7]|uniref:TetR family transcriptional regulator n=1 Tax=Micromonospora parastrephiae TaxID=2806101 RepID=A0ABS1XXX8_9ACTN|nr:hypothetical protein [Micromonospora parastrephiae]MBM0234121.1 hypothetical protein [Micromonospora parastrephiae]
MAEAMVWSAALRAGSALPDPRLEALRRFTLTVLDPPLAAHAWTPAAQPPAACPASRADR